MNKTIPRIIFDYSNFSEGSSLELIRHIYNLEKYFKEQLEIEVMAYGKGLDLLLKANNELMHTAQQYAKPVKLLACHNSMLARQIGEEALVKTAMVVASGLGHIVDRQLEGWAYIKT